MGIQRLDLTRTGNEDVFGGRRLEDAVVGRVQDEVEAGKVVGLAQPRTGSEFFPCLNIPFPGSLFSVCGGYFAGNAGIGNRAGEACDAQPRRVVTPLDTVILGRLEKSVNKQGWKGM